MERLERIGNEYATHGFSPTSQMSPDELRTTNEHVPDNQNAYTMHNGQTENITDINWRVQDSTRYMYICERIFPADQFLKSCTVDCISTMPRGRKQEKNVPRKEKEIEETCRFVCLFDWTFRPTREIFSH